MTFTKQRFFKNFAFYTFFAFLNRGMSFLLIPLFTRFLTPEDYGIYALFLTAVLISEPFITLCVHDAIGIVYYKQEQFNINAYVSTFMFFCAGTILFQMMLIGSVLLAKPFGVILPTVFLLAPLVAFSYTMLYVLGLMWQLQETPIPFGKFNLFYTSSRLSLQMIVVAVLSGGWQGILWVQSILAVITILLGFMFLRKNGWLSLCFKWECLRYGLKFGVAFIPNAVSTRLNESIGRLLVGQKFDLSQVGIYSAGHKMGGIMGVYNQAFLMAYRPWILKKLSGDVRQERLKIILSVGFAFASIVGFALVGSLGMYMFSGFVLGENFEKSVVFVFWAVSSYSLHGMYNVVSLFIYQTGKSWILSLLTMTTVSVNALFTWYFLQAFGLIGAAYAPVLAWAFTLALAIAVAVKLVKSRF